MPPNFSAVQMVTRDGGDIGGVAFARWYIPIRPGSAVPLSEEPCVYFERSSNNSLHP